MNEEDWAQAAVDALMTFDQQRFEAVIAVLSREQLAVLAANMQAAALGEPGAFDHLLYTAGAAMCDALLQKQILTSFDANGGYV